eukprot:Rmarinus@m.28259
MAAVEFQKQIVSDICEEDGLVVLGRGLGLYTIIREVIHRCFIPGRILLLLNFTEAQEESLFDEPANHYNGPLPKRINSDFQGLERQRLYKDGGVLLVSSPILQVDLLNKRVPIGYLHGIVVNNAHRLNDQSTEAFIIRLLKQQVAEQRDKLCWSDPNVEDDAVIGNRAIVDITDDDVLKQELSKKRKRRIFVKAFTDFPEGLSRGYRKVERVMRLLNIRRLYLWPRFREEVQNCLSSHPPEAIDLKQPLTPDMEAIQSALIGVIDACIAEIKDTNSGIDLSRIDVDDIMFPSFDSIIRSQLEPIWQSLSSKTKRLMNDLRTLRQLLYNLLGLDCVSFYHYIRTIRKEHGSKSVWLLVDEANSAFLLSKHRLFPTSGNPSLTADDRKASSQPMPEENPKWKLLVDTLREIKEIPETSSFSGCGRKRTIVVVWDDSTLSRIREYLCYGGEALLHNTYNRLFGSSAAGDGVQDASIAAESDVSLRSKRNSSLLAPPGPAAKRQRATAPHPGGPKALGADHTRTNPVEEKLFYGVGGSDDTAFMTVADVARIGSLLPVLQPQFFVLYDSDVAFMREIEVYKARNPGLPVRVYLLTYCRSIEEKKYVARIRQEQNAFEQLIRQKANMVLSLRDEDLGDSAHGGGSVTLASGPLGVDDSDPSLNAVTRKMGGQSSSAGDSNLVIVDMREFRSSLPALLHDEGLIVHPLVIEVGDYVLTPDICVERKSIRDLIQSFISGRLLKQTEALCQHYKTPVLLIECSGNQTFSLLGQAEDESAAAGAGQLTSVSSVTSKLALLTIHYPALRVIWSTGPRQTAAIFKSLKMNAPNPDPTVAAAVGEVPSPDTQAINSQAVNLLRKTPGVTEFNYRAVVDECDCVSDLARVDEDTLIRLLGERNAKDFKDFLDTPLSVEPAAGNTGRTGGRGRS